MRGIAVISDLHLIEHHDRVGRGVPFFKSVRTKPDEEIVAFVEYAASRTDVLIINGDFVDFDLIAPQGEHDPAYEQVARLELAYEHHKPVFKAIREYLKPGKAVALVVGNHDLEWFRADVRKRLVELLCGESPSDLDRRFFRAPQGLDILQAAVPRLFFYLHGFDLEGLLWAEHGHMFDPYGRWPDAFDPWLEGDLYYPVGSLVNRYITLEMWSFNPFIKGQVLGGLKSYIAHYLKYHLLPPWRTPMKALFGMLKVLKESLKEAMVWRGLSGDAEPSPSNALYPAPVAIARPLELVRTLWLDRFALGLASVLAAAGFAVAPMKIAWRLALSLGSLCALPAYELAFGTPQKGRRLAPYIERVKLAAKRKGAKFFVFSHTHEPVKIALDSSTVLNPGCFAPMCADVECNELLPDARCGLLIEHRDDDWLPRFFRIRNSSLEEFEPAG